MYGYFLSNLALGEFRNTSVRSVVLRRCRGRDYSKAVKRGNDCLSPGAQVILMFKLPGCNNK